MTAIEVIMAVFVIGLMILSLYSGFTFAFAQIRISKENVRATQILEERMEVVRLLNWDQVVNFTNYVPSSFTAAFLSGTNASAAYNPTNVPVGSLIYTGAVAVAIPAMSENYSNDLRQITIDLSWASGGTTHQRQMQTFVSQFGLQKYVY